MKKCLHKISIIVFVLFCATIFGSGRVFADEPQKPAGRNIVSGVTNFYAPRCGNHDNGFNTTIFYVTPIWGSDCQGENTCKIYQTFHCITHGAACSSTGVVTGVSVTFLKRITYNGEKWDRYGVHISVLDGYQHNYGEVIRKVQTVKLKAIGLGRICKTKNGVETCGDYTHKIKIPDSPKKVIKGETGKILPGDHSANKWKFDEWREKKKCSGEGNGRACVIEEMKNDAEVTALFTKRVTEIDPDTPGCGRSECIEGRIDTDADGNQTFTCTKYQYFGWAKLDWIDDSDGTMMNSQYSGEVLENSTVYLSAPCEVAGGHGYKFVGGFGCGDSIPVSPNSCPSYTAHYLPYHEITLRIVDAFTGGLINEEKQKLLHGDPITLSPGVPGDYYIYYWDGACAGSGYTCSPGAAENDETYTVYVLQKVSLTGIAYDDYEQKYLDFGGSCTDTYSGIWRGEAAQVSVDGFNCNQDILNEGYSFIAWDIGGTICPNSTYATCFTPSLNDSATVIAHYEKNVWAGRIKVNGTNVQVAAAGDGYTMNNAYNMGYVDNCDNGCTVRFDNYIKRVSGRRKTVFQVKRTGTNLSSSPRALSNKTFDKKMGGDNPNGEIVEQDTVVLYPGMHICEEMTFDSAYDAKDKHLKLCVLARGKAQPDDPPHDSPEDPNAGKLHGDGAFINIKVRNLNVAKWDKYQREVYGKPGDTFGYRSSYNPVLQYTYYLRVPDSGAFNRILIDGRNAISGQGQTVGSLFNKKIDPDWNNAFSIYKKDARNEIRIGDPFIYDPGLMDKQSPAPNTVKVYMNDVGSQIKEIALTNRDKPDAYTTPGQVTFKENYGDVDTKTRKETAFGSVPYNFIIHTNITSQEPDAKKNDGSPVKQFFAGEVGNISYVVNVDPKSNKETTNNYPDETYTTNVKNARHEVVVYYPSEGQAVKKGPGTMDGIITSNPCAYFNYTGNEDRHCGTIDSGVVNLTPGSHRTDRTFYVQDLPAGSEICIASAVFPASSGLDTNWSDLNYDYKWRISESKCYKIIKRPNMQIWGGNVYSTGAISTLRTLKRNLYGYTRYNLNSADQYYIFGSFGEHGVISRAGTSGFASGATLGYGSNSQGRVLPNPFIDNKLSMPPEPGGSRVNSYCKQIPLTIANSDCSGDSVGGTGGQDATDSIALDIDAIQSLLDTTTDVVQADGGTVHFDGSSESDRLLYKSNGDLTVDGGELRRSSLRMASGSNVNITGNIVMTESFSNFREIPKAVIHATNTIYIGCDVTHLDALLIANRVITCNNIDTSVSDTLTNQLARRINDRANSNQLYINGAVLAGRIYPNRTYGSGNGANSVVPAEIIDFDPSLYMWGGVATSDDDESYYLDGGMVVTYIKELAPRY